MSEKVEQKGSKIFNIKYSAKCGMFTQEELEQDGAGGCDSLIVIPILKRHPDRKDSEKAFVLGGLDGFNKEVISDEEVFQAMVFLINTLVKSPSLKPWQIQFCAQAKGFLSNIAGYVSTDLEAEAEQDGSDE